MKYRLKKDLPGWREGDIIGTNDNGEIDIRWHPEAIKDWFEPVEDRIRLRVFGINENKADNWVRKMDSNDFTKSELDLMEQAINGELFTRGNMCEFAAHYFINNKSMLADYQKELDKWIKENKS